MSNNRHVAFKLTFEKKLIMNLEKSYQIALNETKQVKKAYTELNYPCLNCFLENV